MRDLAKRADAAAAPNGQSNDEAPATLASQIHGMEKHFQRAMPRGAEAGQLIRDALTCLRGTPKLAECEPMSVLGALMTCAQLGLRPGVAGLGHAWPLPLYNGRERRMEATLIIGYRGYTELAYRHPMVKSIASRVVYTNDEFDLSYSIDGDHLMHRPCLTGSRGTPRLYYAQAQLDGGHALTEPWTQEDMEAHRDQYAMAKKRDGTIVGPWRDHFVEMARKTMVRGPLVKMIPLSTELALAAAVDEGVRVDLAPDVDPAEVTERPTVQGELENSTQALYPGQEDLAGAAAEAAAQAAEGR